MNEIKNDDLSTPLKILSLCCPIGIILFFVKRDNEPAAAKQACNMALIGFGISIVLNIIAAKTGLIGGGLLG